MLSLTLEKGIISVKNDNKVILDNINVTVNKYSGASNRLTPVGIKDGCVELEYKNDDNDELNYTGTLSGQIKDGVLILRFGCTLGHDHACAPSSFRGNRSVEITFDSVNASGIMANYQSSPWWTRPAFGTTTGQLPDRTLSVLLDMDKNYVHLYPMCDDIYRTCIKGEGEKTVLYASTCCAGYAKMDGVFMAIGAGKDPYDTVHDTMAAGFASVKTPIPMKDDRRDIESLDYLGWCTYDAFYREVTHDKIIEKLKELKEKKIPIKMLLIDSGWFIHNGDGTHGQMATDLRANPEKFPKGLKGLIDEVKTEYGIERVGIWHGLSVIWQGIEKGSYAWEQTKDYLVELKSGMCFPAFDRTKAFGFYNYWHSYLKGEGVDFIKVDLQAEMPMMAENIVDINTAMKELHAGFEASAALHFDGDVINCMGMSQENVQSRPLSGVARNSDDFFPQKENGFSEHFLQNGYNSVYHGQIYYCDFDMWWTKHESAKQSAILRAVSGGPVYVSDRIGDTVGDQLVRLCDSDGILLRCDDNGTICRDNLFSDPSKDGTVAKMFNRYGDCGLVAAFNTDEEGKTVEGYVKASDVEKLEGDKFLCYLHNAGAYYTVTPNKRIPLTLNKNEGDLAVFAPIMDGFAALGLTDKYVCPATVLFADRYSATLSQGGKFAFYREGGLDSVYVDGVEVPFETVKENIYTVDIADTDDIVTVEFE